MMLFIVAITCLAASAVGAAVGIGGGPINIIFMRAVFVRNKVRGGIFAVYNNVLADILAHMADSDRDGAGVFCPYADTYGGVRNNGRHDRYADAEEDEAGEHRQIV